VDVEEAAAVAAEEAVAVTVDESAAVIVEKPEDCALVTETFVAFAAQLADEAVAVEAPKTGQERPPGPARASQHLSEAVLTLVVAMRQRLDVQEAEPVALQVQV